MSYFEYTEKDIKEAEKRKLVSSLIELALQDYIDLNHVAVRCKIYSKVNDDLIKLGWCLKDALHYFDLLVDETIREYANKFNMKDCNQKTSNLKVYYQEPVDISVFCEMLNTIAKDKQLHISFTLEELLEKLQDNYLDRNYIPHSRYSYKSKLDLNKVTMFIWISEVVDNKLQCQLLVTPYGQNRLIVELLGVDLGVVTLDK